MVLKEQEISAKLEEVISSIEKKPQINVVDIKNELETIIKPSGRTPKFEKEPPQMYEDVLKYYNYVCEFIDKEKHNAGPNQVGALTKLNNIKDKYSETY